MEPSFGLATRVSATAVICRIALSGLGQIGALLRVYSGVWVRLFHISLPRGDVLLDVSMQGAPVVHAARDTAAIEVLFDTLATEVISRLKLKEPSTRSKSTSFLMQRIRGREPLGRWGGSSPRTGPE